MTKRSKLFVLVCVGAACLSSIACYGGSGSVYVGVSGPGPWYGYPRGGYPGGVWVGAPICCAMGEPLESTDRYAETVREVPDGEAKPLVDAKRLPTEEAAIVAKQARQPKPVEDGERD